MGVKALDHRARLARVLLAAVLALPPLALAGGAAGQEPGRGTTSPAPAAPAAAAPALEKRSGAPAPAAAKEAQRPSAADSGGMPRPPRPNPRARTAAPEPPPQGSRADVPRRRPGQREQRGERRAAPAQGDGFADFCASWMQKLAVREWANLKQGAFRKHGGATVIDYIGYDRQPSRCESRARGRGKPGLGILVYHEHSYRKSGSSPVQAMISPAQALTSVEITEVFRYNGKRWVY